MLLTFGLATFGSLTGFEVVGCRPQPGSPVDTTLCADVIGGAGDNHISINKGQTVKGAFFGDGVIGNGGNDTIINNGVTISLGGGTGRNGDIEGDVATGNGGDDVIVNNGTVAGDMDGDTALGNGGNDVLINNGRVGDDMDGDNARKNGGDDLIINNGTIGGDIQADDNEAVDGSVGGDDVIVLNGVVEGSVDGDFGVQRGGNDTVILQNGANGGTDHRLVIDGNGGENRLVFAFIVADKATLDSLSTAIAAADPAQGSLTFGDQTFVWRHFTYLENALQLTGAQGTVIIPAAGQPQAVLDASGAAVYCTGKRLTAIGLDSAADPAWLFTVKAADLQTALAKAARDTSPVVAAAADGQTLSALPSNQFELADEAGRYAFTFAGQMCAG